VQTFIVSVRSGAKLLSLIFYAAALKIGSKFSKPSVAAASTKVGFGLFAPVQSGPSTGTFVRSAADKRRGINYSV
jgi:hypothetical protein